METPLIGNSESIKKIRKLIKYVADTDLNVIITGESGVGKEVVAVHLVHASQRQKKPFIKVDCASLPDGLLESELFGFERGSFTGAYRKKRGKFALADQGVIYLDEIGEMSSSLQSKLLHVLQSGEFAPLGAEKDVRSDAWVIAATNQDLERKVKTGHFRKDLYYRLSTIKIHIPPLRNRPEDISPLIDYYMKRYTSRFNGNAISEPSSSVMKKLMAYSWPGNVRELQNLIKRYVVMGDWDKIIEDSTLENQSVAAPKSEERIFEKGPKVGVLMDFKNKYPLNHASFSLKNIIKEATDMVDKKIISSVLYKTDWNRTKASKILKINYKTLLNKISDLDIKQRRVL